MRETAYNTRWYETLRAGTPIGGPVKHFPKAERRFLNPLSVLSLLTLPITVHGEFWGFLGCEDCHTARRWSDDERNALLAIATAIGAALERQQAQEALHHSEERFRAFSDPARDLVLVLDPDGTVRHESAWLESSFGYAPGRLIGKSLFAYLHPHDVAAMRAVCADFIRHPGTPGPVEFRLQHHNGAWHIKESGSHSATRLSPYACCCVSGTSPNAGRPKRPCASRKNGIVSLSRVSMTLSTPKMNTG